MSGITTINGGLVPSNYTNLFTSINQYFSPGSVAFSVDSNVNVTGTQPVVLAASGISVTLQGATAAADTTAGGNVIETKSNTVIFGAPDDTVTASTGAATLFGASSGQTIFSTGGDNASVIGGGGSIVGTMAGGNSTLIGGNSVSLFTISGSNNLVVAGGSGTTGVDLSGASGPETVATNPNGGDANLVATLGSGADSVIGGGGSSTITAGSGKDVFGFVNGHAGGHEVIIGFNSNDTVAFGGYGYSLTNLPQEQVGGAGDVITLSDGTTVTLLGMDHKIF